MTRNINPLVKRLWSIGLSTHDVAKSMGVSQSAVSRALSGQRNSKLSKKIRAYVQQLLENANTNAV